MNEQMINTLRDYFATQPIEKAWLFGSYSRGEQTEESDVDILVTFDDKAKVGLFKYAHILNGLQDILNKRVDLVVDGSLLPFAIESAEKDKVLIYERVRNQLARMGKQRIDCV